MARGWVLAVRRSWHCHQAEEEAQSRPHTKLSWRTGPVCTKGLKLKSTHWHFTATAALTDLQTFPKPVLAASIHMRCILPFSVRKKETCWSTKKRNMSVHLLRASCVASHFTQCDQGRQTLAQGTPLTLQLSWRKCSIRNDWSPVLHPKLPGGFWVLGWAPPWVPSLWFAPSNS